MRGLLPAGQSALFYDFCLDDHVSDDHSLRQIDRILDLTKLRKHLVPSYNHTGRPSIDPELMIRMLCIGYGLAYTVQRDDYAKKPIEPPVPLWEKGERSDDTFCRCDFVFAPVQVHDTCAGGKHFERFRRAFKKQRTGIAKDNTIRYRAKQINCTTHSLKAYCCPNTTSRKAPRSVHDQHDRFNQLNE